MSRMSELVDILGDGKINLRDNLCDSACNSCSVKLLGARANLTYDQFQDEVSLFTKPDWWGTTTVNRSLTRLSCRKVEEMWFDVMMSYREIGSFLSGFSILSLILYFVTSSDSGSLVIDCLASNGHPEPPRLQRLLWALLEGITATSLLVAGGRQALSALQAMSIATGFIYTILICIACVALWRALKFESGALPSSKNKFDIGVLDPFFTDPFCQLTTKTLKHRMKLFLSFCFNIPAAPFTVAVSLLRVSGGPGPGTNTPSLPALIPLSLLLFLTVLLQVVQIAADGVFVFAWVFYIVFCAGVSIARGEVRKQLEIEGHPLEDFLISLFLYPSVALQMDLTTKSFQITKRRVQNGTQNKGFA